MLGHGRRRKRKKGNRNKTHRVENRSVVAKGEAVGEERSGKLGLADLSFYKNG